MTDPRMRDAERFIELDFDEVRVLAEHILRRPVDHSFAELTAARRVLKVLGNRECGKRLRRHGLYCGLPPGHDGPHVPNVCRRCGSAAQWDDLLGTWFCWYCARALERNEPMSDKRVNPHGLVDRDLLHPDGDYCDRCLTYDERKARDAKAQRG